jgi:hypothetical protein
MRLKNVIVTDIEDCHAKCSRTFFQSSNPTNGCNCITTKRFTLSSKQISGELLFRCRGSLQRPAAVRFNSGINLRHQFEALQRGAARCVCSVALPACKGASMRFEYSIKGVSVAISKDIMCARPNA